MALNGWQRLWVLTAAIWLLAVVFLAYRWWPPADKYQDIRASAIIAPHQAPAFDPTKPFQIVPPTQLKSPPPFDPAKPFTFAEFVERERAAAKAKELQPLKLPFRARHPLAFDRGAVIGSGVVLWMIPSACLYLLGVAVAWVNRGFDRTGAYDSSRTNSILKPRDWWIGVAIIAIAILLHAAYPRYEWRQQGAVLMRIDRWTGSANLGRWQRGEWMPR